MCLRRDRRLGVQRDLFWKTPFLLSSCDFFSQLRVPAPRVAAKKRLVSTAGEAQWTRMDREQLGR